MKEEQKKPETDAPDLEALARAAEQQEKKEQPDFEPGQAEPEPETVREGQYIPKEPTDNDRAAAAVGVSIAETLISVSAKRKGKVFKFTDDEQQQLIEAGAGVVAVSGGELPEWLMPYRPHINLGLVIGGIVIGRAMTTDDEDSSGTDGATKSRGMDASPEEG